MPEPVPVLLPSPATRLMLPPLRLGAVAVAVPAFWPWIVRDFPADPVAASGRDTVTSLPAVPSCSDPVIVVAPFSEIAVAAVLDADRDTDSPVAVASTVRAPVMVVAPVREIPVVAVSEMEDEPALTDNAPEMAVFPVN